MSLSDKLNNASKTSSVKLCKIGVILVSTDVPKEDRETLESILNQPELSPNRVPNSQIARILREEGFDVSNSGVDRHRRKECSCNRLVN